MNSQIEEYRTAKIDIEKVFQEKNPTLAKILPGFFFRYLKRIVHQNDINDILDRHGDKIGIDFANASIIDFNITSKIIGEENIPKTGKFIFASNHPLGGFDALLLLSCLSNYFTDIKFLVNDILMNIKNLKPIFIPINKHGGQSREAIKQLDKTYKSNTQIITFPAGYVSRKTNGRIVDPEWQRNFILKAIQYQRDIIPVHVSGSNTKFFYNLSNLRKFLGIKLNLEMLYLADETFKHKNKHITISIGKPISYKTFDKSKKFPEWALYVKKKVYEMSDEPL